MPDFSKKALDQFMTVYAEMLPVVIESYPDEYCYPVAMAPVVADRMRAAIEAGSWNHGGRAFKATCKRLGIKHTRTAINDFIREDK